MIAERPVSAAFWTFAVLVITYCCLKSIYNLYLHPLSQFPGPKLAAVGSWYEFYYDVIRDGTYLWKIEDMHREYGNLVSIPFLINQ